jgi:hypothetical protein
MAKGSGGTRGAAGGGSNPSMKGYSSGLARAMTERQKEIMMSDTEHTSIFDKNGKEVFRNDKGTANSVDVDETKIANNISIHNHPKGHSFSAGDVATTVDNNGAELRVIGRNGYQFSLKRPKKGWGMTGEQAYEAYNRLYWRNYGKGSKYESSYKGDKSTASRRVNATVAHTTMKQLAKQYGWTYTYFKAK